MLVSLAIQGLAKPDGVISSRPCQGDVVLKLLMFILLVTRLPTRPVVLLDSFCQVFKFY